MIESRLIQEQDLADIVDLCAAEPWPACTKDPQRTWQALKAPGGTAACTGGSDLP
jgi:hypothetical protein